MRLDGKHYVAAFMVRPYARGALNSSKGHHGALAGPVACSCMAHVALVWIACACGILWLSVVSCTRDMVTNSAERSQALELASMAVAAEP